MNTPSRSTSMALGVLGAALGGGFGFFAFFWIVNQGFYGILIPPACLGLGVGLLSRCRSQPLAIACGIAGLALVIFTEWRYRPFQADDSLPFFITHMHKLPPIKLCLMALGVVLGYRMALGYDRSPDAPSAGND